MEKNSRGAARSGSLGRKLAIVFGGLAIVLVVGYFVVTSSGFIKAVVLPKVGGAMNAKVTAGSVSLSPFSQLHLTGLRVETTGTEPLLTADEMRVRYALMDIICGNINVHEITLDKPVVNIVQQADGSSNLDPILEGEEKPKSTEPTRLNVRNISLKNGVIRQVQVAKDGSRSTTEIQNLNLSLDQLGNGQSGKLALDAVLVMEQKSTNSSDVLRGTIAGGYTIALNQELLPNTVSGSTKLTVTAAEGAYQDVAGMNGSLEADVTPTELKRVALVFAKDNQRLGELRASGPLNLDKMEGDLRVELLALDRHALALATAGSGMDFRQTRIDSTNQVTISQGGNFFAVRGDLRGGKISVAQAGSATPETDLSVEYQATVDTAGQTAVLQRLNVSGSSSNRQFLRAELDRQMNLSWGQTLKGYRDASLRVAVTNLNLAEWRPVVGTNISAGLVNANGTVTAQEDGRKLGIDLNTQIAGLTGTFASNQLSDAGATIDLAALVEQMKLVNLTRVNFALTESRQPLLRGESSGRYHLETEEASLRLSVQGELPRLLRFAALTNVSANAGRLELSSTLSQNKDKRVAVGSLAIRGFTGSYETYRFTNYQVAVDYNLDVDDSRAEINQLSAALSDGFNAGGSVDLKGRYNLKEESGQFTFNTINLNQNGLRPFLAPSLGENQLVSIALNSRGEAAVDPKSGNAVKANFKVSNWVVKDPAGSLPQTPLAAELNVDAGMQAEKVDLREFGLKLTPTDRAKNELIVQGKLDLSTNKPGPSTLAVRAESLDVTPYYDIFSGGTNAPAQAQASTPQVETEPEPMQLPFQQLAAELKIDRFFLREVAISNWTGQLNIRSNVVSLQPFKFDLNGGAVTLTANVDTAVAGYRYDLGFQAGRVPLLPLANSFGSGGSNQLDGMLIADARIAGLGTTGPNLRKHLGGQFAVNLTNLNYEVVGPKMRRIIVPISLALRVPELTQTPVNWVSLNGRIGEGVVELTKMAVESEAFHAESAGQIVLLDVLTNSTLNLPLQLALRRSLAEKTRILPTDTPPDAKYAALPQFVSVKGTVGAPETDIDKLRIAGILARSAAGFGLGNERAEQALGAVGNLLTGQRGSTNASGTNAPASTNASPAANLLQNLGGLLGGGATNNAATNAAGTNPPARLNPLDLFRRPQSDNK